MTCPEDPPPTPLTLDEPSPSPHDAEVALPIPLLDETFWRFVFEDDPDEEVLP
jgi:hypothetical protein